MITEYDSSSGGDSSPQINVSCSLCFIPSQKTVALIPARSSCLSGWRKDSIMLVTITFEYVDQNVEANLGVQQQVQNDDHAVCHYVVTACHVLHMTPRKN